MDGEVVLDGAPVISAENADIILGNTGTISAAGYEGGKVEIDLSGSYWGGEVIVPM